MKRAATKTFAVPATGGNYAPEVLYLSLDGDNVNENLDYVRKFQALIQSFPASATLELEVLKIGGAKGTSGDYIAAKSFTGAIGITTLLDLLGCMCRLRAKSGGTSGNMVVDAFWE